MKNLKILTLGISIITVILLSGCLENTDTELPVQNTKNLTSENLKTGITDTIDSIKFYRYNISVEDKYVKDARDYYNNWIVEGYSDIEKHISVYDYTLNSEYGTVFDKIKNYNIKNTNYFSKNVRTHKTCHGGWFTHCYTTLKGSFPFTTQLSEDWARDDEMKIPFETFDTLSAMKEILNNSALEILSEDEKNYKIEVHLNDAGREILIRHAEITYKTGGTTYGDDFESVCNNLIGGLKNLTLIIYADKKTLAINKIYAKGTFKGVYGKSELTVNENLWDFNRKTNIEIPEEIKRDIEKR